MLRFTRALPGLAPSPFLLPGNTPRCLGEAKIVAEPRRALHVHDLMTGGRDHTQAKERRVKAVKIIRSATFEIHQWNSNVEYLEEDTKLSKTGIARRSQSKASLPESGHLQRLMPGLVGDPLRAKMAKEAISFLKGVSRPQPSGSHDNRSRRRLSPFPVQCYSCYG